MICLLIRSRHYCIKKKNFIALCYIGCVERDGLHLKHLLSVYTKRDANKSRLCVNIHVKANICDEQKMRE